MAYTTIDDSEAYFQTLAYTGAGGTQVKTFTGETDMVPDMVWIKCTDQDENNGIYDITRGGQALVSPNLSGAESTISGVTAFGSNGFTVGASGTTGYNTQNYVSYSWNTQGGAGSSNTDGSINTTTTSVGQTQGFSISTYTGTGSNATVGHGLSAAPEMIIIKRRNGTSEWLVYHKGFASDPHTDYMVLHGAGALVDDATAWQDTAPTTSVYSIGTYTDINASGGTMVAFAWRGVQGFSKFGSYEGNGNADGTFVYTGFRPAWIMCKSTDSTSNWQIFNNKRLGYNVDNNVVNANITAKEVTTDYIDMLSNGFKCRIATDPNVAETYIYAAFAEAPLVNSEGVPCNAR